MPFEGTLSYLVPAGDVTTHAYCRLEMSLSVPAGDVTANCRLEMLPHYRLEMLYHFGLEKSLPNGDVTAGWRCYHKLPAGDVITHTTGWRCYKKGIDPPLTRYPVHAHTKSAQAFFS